MLARIQHLMRNAALHDRLQTFGGFIGQVKHIKQYFQVACFFGIDIGHAMRLDETAHHIGRDLFYGFVERRKFRNETTILFEFIGAHVSPSDEGHLQ